jgi:hypothetical protein
MPWPGSPVAPVGQAFNALAAATARTRQPEPRRRDASVYLDEGAQRAQPRRLRHGHARRGQRLPAVPGPGAPGPRPVPRETVLSLSANARNKVYFTCSPEDAHALARHTGPGTPCPNSTNTTWPTSTPTPPPPDSSSTPAPPVTPAPSRSSVAPRSLRSTTPRPCGPWWPSASQSSRRRLRVSGGSPEQAVPTGSRPDDPGSPGGAPGGSSGGADRGASRTAPPNAPPPTPNSPAQRAKGSTRRGPERPWRVSPTGTGKPRHVDVVLGLQARLTDRGETLLGWLADHHVLTTPQITHALFGSTGSPNAACSPCTAPA